MDIIILSGQTYNIVVSLSTQHKSESNIPRLLQSKSRSKERRTSGSAF